MDFDTFSKLAFGLVSSLGTMALVFFNLGQTRKVKAELLEKFEEAVTRESIHSVTELFRLIHGLRMSYRDIVELIKHDQCSRIIYALKKTPGIVSYANGEFQLTNIAKNRIFRFLDVWFTRLSIAIFSALCLLSWGMVGFGNAVTSILGFGFLIFCSIMLTLQLRQRAYNQMIQSLIKPEGTREIQPIDHVSVGTKCTIENQVANGRV